MPVQVLAVDNQVDANDNVVIWYLPHPDDETIGMAGAIISSIRAGYRNIFVYLTRGGNTLVRIPSLSIDGGTSVPDSDVKSARMSEARAALAILGANPDDIVFYDYPDGQLRYHQVLDVIESYYATYPKAVLNTVSLQDTHPDHKVTAAALTIFVNQLEEKPDARFYRVYTYLLAPEKRRGTDVVAEMVPDMELKLAAMAVYQNYDPSNGRFAVGGRSAPRLFQNASTDLYEYRDAGLGEVTAFGPIYVMVEPHSISTGIEYVSAAYPWRLIIKYETLWHQHVTLQADYRFMNVMANGRFYAGGAVTLDDQSLTSSLLVGVSAFNTIYVEYKKQLSKIGNGGMVIGLHFAL
jgi:LmbE family N-acetylglucosaminyl deacetylase